MKYINLSYFIFRKFLFSLLSQSFNSPENARRVLFQAIKKTEARKFTLLRIRKNQMTKTQSLDPKFWSARGEISAIFQGKGGSVRWCRGDLSSGWKNGICVSYTAENGISAFRNNYSLSIKKRTWAGTFKTHYEIRIISYFVFLSKFVLNCILKISIRVDARHRNSVTINNFFNLQEL